MKIVRLLWTVALNVAALLVVLEVFKIAASPFETIVVAGLALIYASTTASWAWLGRAMAEGAHSQAAQYIELAKLLKHPESTEYGEVLDESAAALAKSKTTFWINVLFNAIISLIAMWRIVRVVT